MMLVRCPRCGLVAAFGTPEQRMAEIKKHSCRGSLNHPTMVPSAPTGGAA